MKQKHLALQVAAAVGVIGLLLIATVYLLYNQAPVQQAMTRDNRAVVETTVVSANHNQPVLSLYGYVVVPTAVEISSPLEGVVEVMQASPGQRVRKGDLLLSIDPTDYQQALQEAQAHIKEINAQIDGEKRAGEINQTALEQEQKLLALSQKRLDRQQQLAKTGAVAQIVLENSQRETQQHQLEVTNRLGLVAKHESQIEILRAKREAANVVVEKRQHDLQDTKLFAPSDGVISDVNVAEGSRVERKELIRMIPDGNYEVRAQIPAKHAAEVREQLTQQKTVAAKIVLDDAAVAISLDRLLPIVNDGQMSQQAVFTFKNSKESELFAHKMPVYIRLTMPAIADSYIIETTALYPNNTIYVLDDNNTLEAVEIQKQGYVYDDNDRALVIITTDKDLEQRDVMSTHIPNPATGLTVKKYSEIQ